VRFFRTNQAWLPAAFWALFALLILFFRTNPGWVDTTRGFLGTVLPLLGGILAAYAVLDDPALELILSAPISAGRLLAMRLSPPLLLITAAATTFQLFLLVLGFDLRILGSPISFQLSWLIPTLTLAALGAAVSFASRQCSAGALAVGAVWIVQLIARGWFLRREAVGHLYLFLGIFRPRDPRLPLNRIVLTTLAAALFATSWLLLKKQERYI
jgi:hypothetical protein